MFDSKILFVIGAGASKEANLPTGNELKSIIAGKVDIRYDIQRVSGEEEIVTALRVHVKDPNGKPGDINPYLHAGWRIRDAMPQALSIDNFIDAHQGNEEIEIIGKLAIVRSILEAEKRSLLFFNELDRNPNINFERLEETWFTSFMQLLTEGCVKDQIPNQLSNVSIISFNYDRCIEHFLFHALRNYYGIEFDEAAEWLGSLTIFHPYGVVGYLPWQNELEATDYGNNVSGANLLSRAQSIKTFTEQIENKESISEMHKAVEEAEIIVFLGFAFHRQNMELITPIKSSIAKHVYATALDISKSDCAVVERQILKLIRPQNTPPEINIRNDKKCGSLLKEYWRSLTH